MENEIKHFMYGVFCQNEGQSCGLVELTEAQYLKQLSVPSKTWRCPNCRAEAAWDDDSLCMDGE